MQTARLLHHLSQRQQVAVATKDERRSYRKRFGSCCCMVRSLRAVVFAGGASRRMGTDKAFLCHQNGETWLGAAVSLLRSLDLQVHVLSSHSHHRDLLADQAGVTVQSDPGGPAGPLNAFSAVLSDRDDEALLTLPVDMPRLQRSTLVSLLSHWRQSESSALVSDAGDRLQPLFAVYPCGVANRIALDDELVQGRGRWFGWLERIPYRTFRCSSRELINVNRPDDLTALIG